MMDKAKKRNGFLDFLKLVFAIIIVIGHGDTIYGTLRPDKIIPLASFGVDFFFIVSGAMLLRSAEKQKHGKSFGLDTLKFMKHKIKGLLPNYYVAWIALFILLSIGLNFESIVLGFFKAIPELLFLDMTGIPVETYNGNTWYISAMLLSILIIYPMIRKNKDIFIKYIAPIIVIFGLGYITHELHSILVIKEWNGLVYYGLIRGMVEICIGCITYELSKKLKTLKLTKIGTGILTFVEIFLYIGVIVMLFSYGFRSYCFVLLFILMISICITLSDISYSKNIFGNKIFNWMGKYSYSLYLGHSIAYSGFIGKRIFNSGIGHYKTLLVYFILALICGLFVMYASKLWTYLVNKNKTRFKKTLIASN